MLSWHCGNEFSILLLGTHPLLFVNQKPVYIQNEKKPHEEIHGNSAAQQALSQLRRCYLALWPGLIWFNSACSLRSVCLPLVPVENTYHTGQETSQATDTTPSVHAGSNLCCSFPVLAWNQCLHNTAYWFKSALVSEEGKTAGGQPSCFFLKIAKGRARKRRMWKCSYCKDVNFWSNNT